jgi:RNA-directed DNA polymerase
MPRIPKLKLNDSALVDKFHDLTDLESVADLLEVNAHNLRVMFYGLRSIEPYYHEFTIKKKSGGERTILAPDQRLKFIQRRLAYILSLLYMGRASVHGFRTGKSILSNAERHARRKIVLNLDLENFFPTIHFGRVRGMLQARPYSLSRSAANVIAGLCCYKGKLPQGAPTSPIISNMVCARLDYDLQSLAKEEQCTYSRYADDITFSTSKRNFSEGMAVIESGNSKLGPRVISAIALNSFQINEKKTRIRYYTERQEVTGLVVNRFPNVKRGFIREVRMMLHIWGKYGLDSATEHYNGEYNSKTKGALVVPTSFYEVLRGKINFIKLVKTENDHTYQNLARRFNELAGRAVFKLIAVKNWPDEEYVRAGERFKGIDFLARVFDMADGEIFILDNYLDGEIVSSLEGQFLRNPLVHIKLLISRKDPRPYGRCIVALKELVRTHPEIKLDCREGLPHQPGGLHGRFIVIDNLEIYQSGHSFTQLGERSDRISRIRNQTPKREALSDFASLFTAATSVVLRDETIRL